MFSKSKPNPLLDQIALLKDERDYLRARIVQLEQQLLAISNANAFRLLHRPPETTVHGTQPPVVTVYEEKASVFEPTFTLDSVAKGKVNWS